LNGQGSCHDYITGCITEERRYVAINSYSVRKPFNQTGKKKGERKRKEEKGKKFEEEEKK
jgi:hypothetical protein